MFGSLGATEILVLAVIGLLVFGPRRLPEMGRTLGKTLYEFRKAAMELRTSVEREINLEELKQAGQTIREGVRDGAGLLSPPSIPATPMAPAAPQATLSMPMAQADPAAPAAPTPSRSATLADAVEAASAAPNRKSPGSMPAAAPPPSRPSAPDSPGGEPTANVRPDEAPGSGNVVPKG